MGMKSNKNKESNIKSGKKPTVVAKNATTESFSIDGDHLVMYLHDTGAKNSQYVRVDLNDYYTFDKFYMIMDREKLKGMADFIYKYLENN
jgi:hypothetical protein